MAKIKKSFLREIIGNDIYDSLWISAVRYLLIYILVTGLVFLLTRFFYWKIISNIYSALTGWSFFSLLFIGSLMMLCNIECDADEEICTYENRDYSRKEDNIDSRSYKLTIAWFIVLCALGISIAVISDRARCHYKFQCSTYLVDYQNRIYHIPDCDECEYIVDEGSLIEMKGYEIERKTDCQLCSNCKDWYEAYDMEILEHTRH